MVNLSYGLWKVPLDDTLCHFTPVRKNDFYCYSELSSHSFWERNGELRAKPGVFQCSSYPNRRLFCSSPKVLKEMVESLQDIQGISRVLYDLTAKPPGTTEWE